MIRYASRPVVIALLTLVCAATFGARPDGPFLRRPDIHGDRVVFSSEGDLWLASLSTGQARRLTSAPAAETEPRFSPDGARIAFTGFYDGGRNVYVMPAEGGAPERLTWDPTGVRVVGWTPDGEYVLYTSAHNNPERRRWLYRVPAGGGTPEPLPIPWVVHADMDADGNRVAYVPISAEWQHWKNYTAGQADDIWLADIAHKTFRRLTTHTGVDTTPAWAGGMVYFVSERDGHANLYRLDPDSGAVTPATGYTDDEVRYPASDGTRIVYELGNGLGLYDPTTGQERELAIRLGSDRIHTRPRLVSATAQLMSAFPGPSGNRVLLESRGQIVSVPVRRGEWRVLLAQPGTRARYPAWSPDGATIAFSWDRGGEEQIWTMPADGKGDPKQLTKDRSGPLGRIVWSPDSKCLVTSDRDSRILLVEAESGATKVVDQFDRGGTYDFQVDSYTFSPDGKWIAYHRLEANWSNAVYLYNVASGQRVRVSADRVNAWNPAFSPDGKYLWFLADRDFKPQGTGLTSFFGFDKMARVTMVTLARATESPFLPKNDTEAKPESKPTPDSTDEKADGKKDKKESRKEDIKEAPALPETVVDLDGLSERLVELPLPGDRYQRILPVKDRLLLLVAPDPGAGGTILRLVSLKDPEKIEAKTIGLGFNEITASADGSKVMIRDGSDIRVMDAGADTLKDEDRVDVSTIRLEVDPPAEWRQMFDEAWRVARDFFYDPNLHGVDWAAVRAKYEPKLAGVLHRNELNELLGDMYSELRTGHAYVGGGDTNAPPAPSTQMGFLGANLAPVAGADAVRITRILRGDGYDYGARSPLTAPGVNVKEGDYILAISGRPVRRDRDVQALMVGTLGRTISLTVNDRPTMEGARDVMIRPITSDANNKALYYDWVAGRRDYVRTRGGENLGYVHIPDMGTNGLVEFAKGYYPLIPNTEGIVYDVRYNGGGYIAAMLLMHMSFKPVNYFKPRYGVSWTYEGWAHRGYSAAVCNDQDYSCAEYFVDLFQKLDLGPVFGTVTGGGLVGSGGGWTLIDGGRVYVPNYAAWSPDGNWVVEGDGAIPDVVVEQDPAAVLDGRDPQLDAAIAYLKKKLEAEPLPKLAPPPFPVKAAG